jgi:RimJ/RimL family protein N-acetyltransferase
MSGVETERLILRPPHPSDTDELAAIFAKPEVWWFPFQRGLTVEETESWIDRHRTNWRERGLGQWIAIDRSSDRIVGYCGLAFPTFLPEIMPAVEVGYRLDPLYWDRGFATEGARAALRFGFDERALDRIVGIYETENERSGRVMERLGMTFDRDTVVPDGPKVRVMAITREEWARAG